MKNELIDLHQTVIAALDTGKYNDITVVDINNAWEKGEIVSFLRRRLGKDLLYSCFESELEHSRYEKLEAPLAAHFSSYMPRARKVSGVVNSGLCLVAGGIADLIRKM